MTAFEDMKRKLFSDDSLKSSNLILTFKTLILTMIAKFFHLKLPTVPFFLVDPLVFAHRQNSNRQKSSNVSRKGEKNRQDTHWNLYAWFLRKTHLLLIHLRSIISLQIFFKSNMSTCNQRLHNTTFFNTALILYLCKLFRPKTILDVFAMLHLVSVALLHLKEAYS